jgi:hypothetical protein
VREDGGAEKIPGIAYSPLELAEMIHAFISRPLNEITVRVEGI